MMTTELNVIQTASVEPSVSIMHEFYPLLSCARREDKEAGWGVGGWRVFALETATARGRVEAAAIAFQACQRA